MLNENKRTALPTWGPRVVREPKETLRLLCDHVGLLVTMSKLFDQGDETAALPMAMSLRVLVHGDKDEAGLVKKFGLFDVDWFDSATFTVDEGWKAETSQLTVWAVGGPKGLRIQPLLPAKGKSTPFAQWWSAPILHTLDSDDTLDRRGAVLFVANFDATHVGSKKSAKYHAISTGQFFNIRTRAGDGPARPLSGMHRALIRGIAHEVILTVSKHLEWATPAYCWQPTFEPKTTYLNRRREETESPRPPSVE